MEKVSCQLSPLPRGRGPQGKPTGVKAKGASSSCSVSFGWGTPACRKQQRLAASSGSKSGQIFLKHDMMEIFLCNLLHKILEYFAEKQKYLMLSCFRLIHNISALEHIFQCFQCNSCTRTEGQEVIVLKFQVQPSHVVAPYIYIAILPFAPLPGKGS